MMASTLKTPRTIVQDFTKGIPTEKSLHPTRTRPPLILSPQSKRSTDSPQSKCSTDSLPRGPASKKSSSSSFSELSESTPRHLVTGFLTTHNSTLPLTRQQSRVNASVEMLPPSAQRRSAQKRRRSAQKRRRSSLGIPRLDEIVKHFTPRTAIQGLLSQAAEQTPFTGNADGRKSRSQRSLPGVDSLLRDTSFEPLHKSFVSNVPSSKKLQHGTRQHRPIQFDVVQENQAMSSDDYEETENEVGGDLSHHRSPVPLPASEGGEAVNITTSPSANRRKSHGKDKKTNATMAGKTTPPHSPSRRRSQRTDAWLSGYISGENVSPASSSKVKRRNILTPSSPSSRRLSSQKEAEMNGRNDRPTSSNVKRKSSLMPSQSEVGRNGSFLEENHHDTPLSSTQNLTKNRQTSNLVNEDSSTHVDSPGKRHSLRKQAMLNASRVNETNDNPTSPSTAGRSLSQKQKFSPENIAPSSVGKRRSTLKQTTIDFGVAGEHAGSPAASTRSLTPSSRRVVVAKRRHSVGDESSKASVSSTRTSGSAKKHLLLRHDSSFPSENYILPVLTSTPSTQKSSQRRSSLRQTFHSGNSVRPPVTRTPSPEKSSSLSRSSLRQSSSSRNSILPTETRTPSPEKSSSLSRSSLRQSSSSRNSILPIETSTRSPRRRSSLAQAWNDKDFDDTDEPDGDEISSVVENLIGQLASENDAENIAAVAMEGSEDEDEVEVVDGEVMETHEEEGDDWDDVEDDEEDDEEEIVEAHAATVDSLNKNSHIDNTEQSVRNKTPRPRKPRKLPEPYMPISTVKGLFTHFSRAKVSKEAIAEVVAASGKFWKSVAGDMEMYAKHAKRKTINDEDVELLMRRQGFISDRKSLNTLVHEYLPLELREQVLHVARSGNKIELNKKFLS